MCSLFCAEEEEHFNNWVPRAFRPSWKDDSHGCCVDIVISKMRTIVEANQKNTPAVHRFRYMLWLGFLTQRLLEAEVCMHLHVQHTIIITELS